MNKSIRSTVLLGAAFCIVLLGGGCAQDTDSASGSDASGSDASGSDASGSDASGSDSSAAGAASGANQALLARGEYLVEGILGCGNCHSGRTPEGEFVAGMEYAGNFVIEEPIFRAYAPNITPAMETGIGSWTDEQIIRAVREGVRPDGQILGPPMSYPFFRDISDNDMRAVVAYLRSVPAVENVVPRSTYNIPLPPNWGPPITAPVPDVSPTDTIAYGRYLAHTLGHCTDCHTPLVDGAHDFSRTGAGGNLFHAPFGFTWSALAANITQHPELGIGSWTDDEIKRAITQGISRDGRQLLPFMGFSYYAKISAGDLDAIVAYLRTLPPATAVPPAAAPAE